MRPMTLLKSIYNHIARVSWRALLAMAVCHYLTAWAVVAAFEAGDVARIDIFWYYYIVTATTVGYGDYAPLSTGGRAVAVLWVVPGSIALFTALIGKIVRNSSDFWRRRMRGAGDLSHLSDHIVILGWLGDRTRRMVEQMLADTRREARAIVICATEAIDNPMPDQAEWVRGPSLTDPDLLRRAGIATAARTVVYGSSDAVTLTGALAVSAVNPHLLIVAFFDDPSTARLLQSHCPLAEINLSLSIDMIVRSVEDPGSSRLQRKLLSVTHGQTQFSVTIPDKAAPTDYGTLFHLFKRRYDATLIAVARTETGADLHLNPPLAEPVTPGLILYYVARQRLRADEINWPAGPAAS